MRRAKRREFDEGWLVTAVLCVILAVCAAVYANRLPRKTRVEPAHFISGALLTGVPEPVNVNSADAAALSKLPGIGETLAERIVTYREANGPFICPDDLLRVEGIGEKKLEGMLDYLTCQIP